MINLLKALRRDDHGAVLSAEIVLVGSVLVLGLVTGMTCLQQAVNGELTDVANAFGGLDQSYSFASRSKVCGHHHCVAYTAGSAFVDCDHVSTGLADQTTVTDGSVPTPGTPVGCCEPIVSVVPGILTAPCNQSCGPCELSPCSNCGQSACGGCGANLGPGYGQFGGWGGQSGCGSAGFSFGGRDLDTGVRNMRVSEWPLSNPMPVPMAPGVQLLPHADFGEMRPMDGYVIPGTAGAISQLKSGDINIPDYVW